MIGDHFVGNPCSPQLSAIHRISSALFAKAGVDAILRETLEVAMRVADADAGSILLYDRDTQQLVFRHALGPVGDILVGSAVNLQGAGKCATVFRTGVSDISVTGFDPPPGNAPYTTKSALTTAISNFDGQPVGVVQVLNKRYGAFSESDRELMEIVSALAATVIENARRSDMEKQAALARVLAYVGHDLKNQAYIVQTAEQLFGPDLDAGLKSLQDQRIPEARELGAKVVVYNKMVRDAAAKALRVAEAINEYGMRKNLFEFAPNDLAAVIREELDQLVHLAEQDGHKVDLSTVADTPVFPFDALFVGRAVFNLVNNSLYAIRSGGKKGTVTITVKAAPKGRFPEGDYAEIAVADDGPGMDEEKVTEVLNGEATSTKPGGSGLGTRLVRDVAVTHGGLFLGESAPGSGATFRIRLPLRR